MVYIDTLNAQIIEQSHQLIVVTAKDWNSVKGRMWYFDRASDGKWLIVKANQPIVLGKAGLAPSDSSYANFTDTPLKEEGDNKAPAGIFNIGKTFGFNDLQVDDYIQLRTGIECIDDSNSKLYNTIIDVSKYKKDWSSSENMSKVTGYKYGIEILYNHSPAIAKKGSCIFMHIWKNDVSGTEGCTAMSETDIASLQQWINPSKHPNLVQYPEDVYNKLKMQMNLPNLPKDNNE